MRVSFEPGDGSFEVVLENDEEIPQCWAHTRGVVILREDATVEGGLIVIKQLSEVL